MFSSHVAPASDPTVIVMRDITASTACTYKTAYLSQRACQAGTILASAQVLLSEAQHNHEPYVLLPAKTSSLAVQATVKKQLTALVQTVSSKFSAKIQPLDTGCGHPNHNDTTWNAPDYSHQEKIYSYLNWQIPASNCNNVIITDYWIYALRGYAPEYYWYNTSYSSTTWNEGCTSLYDAVAESPNATFQKGLNFEFVFSNGSWCFPWDNFWAFVIGPIK